MSVVEKVSEELGVDSGRAKAVAELLDEGATIPFIARYRKERTGEMDEQLLRSVRDAFEKYRELEKRRESMVRSLQERELLDDEIRAALYEAATMAELEDVYLPFRPKRATRASKARDKGLEGLAREIIAGTTKDPTEAAPEYLNPELGVTTEEDALAGARDIVAEMISEDRESRARLRALYERASIVESRSSRRASGDKEAETYRDYFSWSEPATRAKSHRLLAMFRGEREGHLVVHIGPEERLALDLLRRRWVSGTDERARQIELALVDGYRRLIHPSLEGQRKRELFEAASEDAARVFSENLRDLLLAPPLGAKRVLAVDPGFRTGCKIVCLEENGELLHSDTIYPLEPKKNERRARERVLEAVREHAIEAIAVGNGTGGRETVAFLKGIDALTVPVISVNEAGASVYSASDVARAELPDHDVTVRGAVSIGRRLIDPLSELVKIEPRSIGVGQYQHDVDPQLLEHRLKETVESCVNAVGADLNTASIHLLRYIAGISERQAAAIVATRSERGAFQKRDQLLKVTGIGRRTYEQAAGFLRIHGGTEPLDATGVHPERYDLVRRMAADHGCEIGALIRDETLLDDIQPERYLGADVGLPTIRDIVAELKRPGRDPRPPFSLTEFDESVHSIDDLRVGMKLPGVVTNVTDFGAFVDIGVHRDGLVHISKLSSGFVRNTRDVVRVGQAVDVTVVDIDVQRKRISLSMAE